MSPEVPRLSRRSFLRTSSGAAVGLGLGLTAAGCGFSSASPGSEKAGEEPIDVKVDGDLVYFNWADFVDPAVFAGFEKEYGVKVIQSNFDSMEGMAAKLNAGNRYDIIFPTAKWAQRLTAGHRLRTIDHSRLKNADAVFSRYDYFADPWYDAGSRHTVPFTMYKTGIGWRKDKIGRDLAGSWGDLWNARAKGKVFVLDDRDEVLGMGALKLGLDVSTADAGDLGRITSTLRSLRPHLRGFSSDSYNNLLNGTAVMTQAWSGDMAAMLGQAKDPSVFGFEVAKEGAPVNSDCYAIPSDARHPGTAMLFIDYMLRPENVKKNIEYIGYPMPVGGSEDTYAAVVEPFPQCLVSADDLKDDLYFRNGDSKGERARDTAWTQVKAG
ncbi:polyamine ABC transporter substrate-binding protein [Streptomyces lunaelactis]|uniref:polyamine ABC transporter substrate-binding protein n=2 Tax=Streptomyces lunaelactis TaxID=1535768 RepID=UPI00158475E8|nr:spermidine/putrescine ABC transporter substrate-binding protein [Streptomyces lunaelactis]NUK22637.1 spermidine/putrescine ABC transporter substrate-binding protein [Streptomyces lunaelactis]NUK58143.1 spermidine/putrescine ABC transporter substrate-binding protein [Streptomyces lunaelactis]NUL12257.1 spermidine/putrescine ABC transporter substrate-binding protein [Streptomyces lunaelactis]NUL25706.1 spermidine/putrescine ABC transporter substrate-binding protein [Streptomyces lunaelactis]